MKIGLVLSGGGTRAAVFHLGVLKHLAESSRLEDVKHISTVSGGSLVTALIFSRAGMKWPTSQQFLGKIYPELNTLLTSCSLLSKRMAFNPLNWPYLTRRSRLVARLLVRRWGIMGNLKDLPDSPIWQINATTFETGKNWCFSKNKMGDWVYGYKEYPELSIAEACAASAAVPYLLGALKIRMPASDQFNKSDFDNDDRLEAHERTRTLRLWDGGVYENLGSERIAKIGENLSECDFVLISDASAPLMVVPQSRLKRLKMKFGSPRLFDVASEQTRSLRIRAFWSDLKNDNLNMKGVHVPIGKTVRTVDRYFKRKRSDEEYVAFLSQKDVDAAARHSTTLEKLSTAEFERLALHGYENAKAAFEGQQVGTNTY